MSWRATTARGPSSTPPARPGRPPYGRASPRASRSAPPRSRRPPRGPYLRFDGQNLRVVVLGQTLTGSFRFEQRSRPDGQRVVTIDVPSASLILGEGLATLNLTGSFLISNGGFAGKLGLGASLNLGPVTLAGNPAVLGNTQTTPATLNDAPQTRVPAGPFFRIEGTGIQVTVAGVVLTGAFALEQAGNQAGQRRLTIAVANGSPSTPPPPLPAP